MTEKLVIKNFGPLKSAEIDLKKILILIGPQSTGKSTIAKLVTILRSVEFVLYEKTFLSLLENYNIKSFLKKDTLIEYSSGPYSFTYQNKKSRLVRNKEHEFNNLVEDYIFSEGDNPRPPFQDHILELISKFINVNKEFNANGSEEKKQIPRSLTKKMDELSTEAILLNKRVERSVKLLSELDKYVNYSVYIPAERVLIPIISNITLNLIQNSVPLPKILLDYGAVFEKAREFLKTQKVDFLNISYSLEGNENRLYFNSKEYILLSEASSGLQSIIPLILVILYKSKEAKTGNTYVIEEPELNLFPATQYALTKLIVENCCGFNTGTKSHNELIITTHSPYILTAFNNFLLADKVGKSKKSASEVQKIISKKAWVSASDFNAFYVNEGTVGKIFDEESGLITENLLDNASEEIMTEFDELMDIYSKTLSHAG